MVVNYHEDLIELDYKDNPISNYNYLSSLPI